MAFDAFLKLGDIKGESIDKEHPAEIEIQSFHWGVSNAGTTLGGGGTGAGKPVPQDLLLTAGSSKASPELFLACATGENIKEGLLTLRSQGGSQTTFSTIKLTNVQVASYDEAGDASGNPMDEFSLRYGKIEYMYNTVKAVFDFTTLKS